MDPLTSDFQTNLTNVISRLKEDLKTIRTGRASSGLLENLMVETYGGQTKLRLMELSTIMTAGPSLITISPFDSSTIQDIERAILKSPLGFSPQVQGNKINVIVPSLSAEQREKFSKLIGQNVEEKRVMMRNMRDDARKKIKNMFEKKELTEDQKFRLEKEIDTINQKFMLEVQTIKESKEKEVMEV